MLGTIQEHLEQLAQKEKLQILLAVESGSRAWGFPSPDSDYDVRIIYQRPVDWYLSIGQQRDIIAYFHGDLLDINGWDIRKTLELLRKSNATPFEWAQSPVVYTEVPGFRERLLDLAGQYFQPVHCLHHYVGIATNSYRSINQEGTVKLKKLFYVIRPVLAARWIADRTSVPPMEINALLDILEDQQIRAQVLQLIAIKERADEDYVHPVPREIRHFLEQQLNELQSLQLITRHAVPGVDQLNDFFRELLENRVTP